MSKLVHNVRFYAFRLVMSKAFWPRIESEGTIKFRFRGRVNYLVIGCV